MHKLMTYLVDTN